MALTNDQLTTAVNAAIQAVHPGVSNGEEIALFQNMLTMMLHQGDRIIAEAEATIVRQQSNLAQQQADAVAREAQERANAAGAAFLAYVASLVQGG